MRYGKSVLALALLAAISQPVCAQQVQLPTGKFITPSGHHVDVGSFPVNVCLSPDGRFAVTTNSGFRQYLAVVDTRTGDVVSRLSVNGARKGGGTEGLYVGLAFAPGATPPFTLYASRGAEESVAAYTLDADGKLTDTGKRLVAKSGVRHTSAIYAGVAVSADGATVYAVDNSTSVYTKFRGALRILSASDGKVVRTVDLPGYPFAVAALTSGPSAGAKAYVSSERDGVVAVVDLAAGKVLREVRTGDHPIAMVLNKRQDHLYVVNSGSDTVSVIDTASDRVVRTILLRPDDLRGVPGTTATGIAFSPDESRLYVTQADFNAVAVVDAKELRLLGYIPTGWYPSSVVVTPDGKRLIVTCAKGVRAKNPNGKSVGSWGQYIENIIEGVVSTIDIPDAQALAASSSQVIVNNRVAEVRRRLKNPGIKHVVYIIKENRTFDQVYGDLSQGNGDSSLTMFPRAVTPNQHAMAERFVLLDNYYCCAEVSADGWTWSTQGIANEYVARNAPYGYSGRGRGYDMEGQNDDSPVDLLGLPDVARSSGGYFWDLLAKKHISFRNYGFFVTSADPRTKGPDGKPLAIDNVASKKALVGRTNEDYRQFDLSYADSEAWMIYNSPAPTQTKAYGKNKAPSRFTEWKREFDQYVKNGDLPRVMLIRLPRNHTNGTSPGYSSPRAMVADNDYALGRMVEEISRSQYWKSTAIFVVEDDAQNGQDHVDAHRSGCLVISPFVKRGTVDSAFHNTDTVLRTMEQLLGLPPMNQCDATASLFGFFTDRPDNSEPYTAILPARSIIAEVNQKTAYRAQDCMKLNFREADAVPDDVLNDILWHATMGANRPAPPIRYSRLPAPFGARSAGGDSEDL